MDLGQLETFLVVAREKSFSRAAERLYRTQPAVSLSLKRLEEELGETLLDRTTKGGTLTDAGTTLLPLAQRMLDLRKQILDTFGSLKGLQLQGHLQLLVQVHAAAWRLLAVAKGGIEDGDPLSTHSVGTP